MKRLIVILAFFATGCAHDLTAPLNSVPVTSMAEYFWTAGMTEALDTGLLISDRITTRDSGGVLLASDSTSEGTLRTTLVCRVSADSVFAEGFRAGSIIDLDDGPGFVDVSPSGTYHSGGVLLLRNNPLVDSSWPAGTMMLRASSNYKSFPIEARLLARLDSLDVGGVSYPDVLAIRYAHEFPDLTVDSVNVPYWVIFYARGRGPIMFDKVGPSTPFERRAIRHP